MLFVDRYARKELRGQKATAMSAEDAGYKVDPDL